MTKGITFLLLLMLLTNWCAAQITAPNDILTTSPDSTNGKIAPRRMIATRDGGFLNAGLIEQKGYISRTSSCGDVIWTQQYLFGAETSLNSVAELPSGEIVAVGACRNCVPGDTTQKALIIKTDVAGTLLRDTMLGRTGLNARANDVTITSDQKIALTGQVVIAAGFAPADAFLGILDEQLRAKTWKEHHQLFYDIGQALIQTSDGGFAIAGWSLASLASSRQAQVFRTDNEGNLLWAYSAPHLSSEFHAIRQAPDGRLVALGDRQVDTIVGRDVHLAAFDDATGALLEEKTYGSPGSDAGNSLDVVDGGFLVGAVYGEPSQSGWNRRDWVFWLDEQFALTDQYFHDGFLFAHDLVNAIPLSPDGKAFAYHSVVHFLTSFYELFFKRTFPGVLATLNQAPLHEQLVPRNLITNTGTVIYTGTLPNPNIYENMRLDVWRDNTLQQSLYDDSPQDFSFHVEIPAELANYTFRLSGQKGQQWYTEAEACHVVAGDAYLIQGQSNAIAGLPFDPADTIDHAYRHYTNPFVRNFGLKFAGDTLYAWHRETGSRGDYADNLSGQWGLLLGSSIVENYGIPVAITNGAVGGIAIETMLPNPNNHGDTNREYGRFLRRVQRSGLLGHLRGIFMFQGETNALPGAANSIDDYFQKFETLDNAWRTDFPALQRRYLFQIRPGWFNGGATLHSCLQIEEAQRRIAETLPDWQIMSSTGMNHDGLHYYYPNGYERAGQDIYRLVARDLYDAPPATNIYPPTVESIRFSHCDRQEITLTLRHTADTYLWTPGWESDFWLEGDTMLNVTEGYVQGSSLVLHLSAAPGPGFTGLSYRSHPEGSEAPVKNANGIGMLTFYNMPVANYDLQAQVLASAASCFGAADGSAIVTGTGGAPDYTYLWSNGFAGEQPDQLMAGVYTVTVSDAKNCTITASATVTEPPALTDSLAVAACPGSSVLLPDGTTVTEPGLYPIHLISSNGCDSLMLFTVDIPALIALTDTLIAPDNGTGNGSIAVVVGGGTPPYAYSWSNGDTTEQADSLIAGVYSITVTDNRGCTQAFDFQVITSGASSANFPLPVVIYPNPCTDVLYLKVPGLAAEGAVRIRVSDLAGRDVMPAMVATGGLTRINTVQLPAGVYVVQLIGNGTRLWTGVMLKL